MNSRLVTINDADNIDNGVAFLLELVVPTLNDQKGYRGLVASGDRETRVLEVASYWETEALQEASESVAGKLRQEALHFVGGTMSVEVFDALIADFSEPPLIGAAQMVTRISMDPATIDENLEAVRHELLPRIKATPGYHSLSWMINRGTGLGVARTEWTDQAVMQAWTDEAQTLRQEAVVRGVSFGQVHYQEILFADLAEDLLSSR